MNTITLIALALAGWMNRQQQEVIEYLREEVSVLKELQGKSRLRFSDDQRRRLARKAKRIRFEPEFGSAADGEVSCRERLGGLLRYFYRLPGRCMKSTNRVFGHCGFLRMVHGFGGKLDISIEYGVLS